MEKDIIQTKSQKALPNPRGGHCTLLMTGRGRHRCSKTSFVSLISVIIFFFELFVKAAV